MLGRVKESWLKVFAFKDADIVSFRSHNNLIYLLKRNISRRASITSDWWSTSHERHTYSPTTHFRINKIYHLRLSDGRRKMSQYDENVKFIDLSCAVEFRCIDRQEFDCGMLQVQAGVRPLKTGF